MLQKQITILVTTLFALLLSNLSIAKTINLYDQPKDNAKIIGPIDTAEGMVPIFTPKDGDWMKVGNPKNGDVGWIKAKELSSEDGSIATSLSITQETINTDKGPKSYQIVKFGTPKPLTAEQNTAIIKQAQLRQLQLQASIQKMMQSFYKEMNDYYKSNPSVTVDPFNNFPMLMPVIVFPVAEPETVSATKTNIKLDTPAVKTELKSSKPQP
jgi:hypothetical protein